MELSARNIANPTAMILSAVDLLRHLGWEREREREKEREREREKEREGGRERMFYDVSSSITH